MSSLNARRLQMMVDATPSVLLTATPDGRVLEPQPSWERFTGQRWPVYRGLGWLDAVHDRAIDLGAGVDPMARAPTPVLPVAARLWHHDSRSFRHVSGRAVPVHDEHGRMVEWVVSVEDVHEQLMARRRLEQSAARLQAVLHHAPVGLALFDPELRFVLLNRALARATGLDPERDRGVHLAGAAPALAGYLTPRLRHVIETGEPVDGVELRGVRLGAAGRRDWLVSCYPVGPGPASSGPTGVPTGELVGVGATLVDVTERNALQKLVHDVSEREAQVRFRSVLDAMVDLVMILQAVRDDHGRVVDFRVGHVNRARPDIAGRRASQLQGRGMAELYPAFPGSRLFDRFVAVVETREPITIEELPYRDVIGGRDVDRVLSMQVAPFEDGVISVSRDVTERRRRRVQLERTFEQLAAAQRLAHIGIWEVDPSSRRVSYSDELQRILRVPETERSGDLDEVIDRFVAPDQRALVRGMVAEAPRTGQPFAADLAMVRADGSPVTVSLYGAVARDEEGTPVRLWGTMQDVSEQRAAEEELRAAAVRLERERAVVTHLQEALLPEQPDVAGLDLAVRYLPAGSDAMVGGDWYDVIPLDEHRVLLVVGDVAGHGLAAAALMAQLRNALRGAAFAGQSPEAMLETLNALLLRTAPDAMATASCGLHDGRRSTFEWATAGHPPPVLHEPGAGPAGARLLDAPAGAPLGISGAVYRLHRAPLPTGATLVLYTDGLVEERGRSIDVGLDRLRLLVGELAGHRAGEACDAITASLLAGRDRLDDVCLLVARVVGPAPGEGTPGAPAGVAGVAGHPRGHS